MRIGAIIQARTSSRRLPGKVLATLAGKPLLEHLIAGLRQASEVDLFVLATSTERSDDPVAEFATSQGVLCHRGSLDDVAGRFRDAAEEHALDGFVRVNGDSPLLDYRLVDRAVRMFRDGEFDLVTNVLPRTFPTGQSVEVVDARFFAALYERFEDPEDLETVTPYIYRHRDRYRIGTFESHPSYAGVRMAVDTEADLANVESMLERVAKPHWEYGVDALVSLYREVAR